MGALTDSFKAVRTLLGASTEFQDWVSAGNASEAEEHVHLYGYRAQGVALPTVLVYPGNGHQRGLYGLDGTSWSTTPNHIWQFEKGIANNADPEAALVTMGEEVEAILEDLETLHITAGMPRLNQWSVVPDFPMLNDAAVVGGQTVVWALQVQLAEVVS